MSCRVTARAATGPRSIRLAAIVSLLLWAVTLAACGDDGAGGTGEAACEDAAAISNGATSVYCEDEVDHCCFCQCWESTGGNFDGVELVNNATCVCVTPPSSPNECSGDALASAEQCLADEGSCAEVSAIVAEALCLDSAL